MGNWLKISRVSEYDTKALRQILGNDDLIALALAGKTVISGGYVITELLTANNIITGKLQSENGEVYFDLDNNVLVCNKLAGTGENAPYMLIDDASDGSALTKALALYSYSDSLAEFVQAFSVYLYGNIGTRLQGARPENYLIFGSVEEGASLYGGDGEGNYYKLQVNNNGAFLQNQDTMYEGEGRLVTEKGIKSGSCALNISTWVRVDFTGYPFASAPRVVLTPNTTVTGSIPGKIKDVDTTGFSAIIGGNNPASGNVNFDYIAVNL